MQIVTMRLLAALVGVAGAHPGSSPDIPISTGPGLKHAPAITASDRHGAIVAWLDRRGPWGIYAQRLDARGVAQWASGGRLLSAEYTLGLPVIASDGAGGAIVAWTREYYEFDVRAQRIDALGMTRWGDGITLGTGSSPLSRPAITPDGTGGAFIAWPTGSGSSSQINAQHLDASGQVLWAPGGVHVATDIGWPSVAAATDGGAILAWFGRRGVSAQKLGADGSPQWGDTMGLSGAMAAWPPKVVPDDEGGAYLVWAGATEDFYVTGNIYAQRLDRHGRPRWGLAPLPVCEASSQQVYHLAEADGRGGVVMAWQDWRSGTNYDLYAQRLTAEGAALWGTNGLPVCTAAKDQVDPTLAPDGRGGLVLAWMDQRDLLYQHRYNIYAQAIDAHGSVQWTPNGHPVCTLPTGQGSPVAAFTSPSRAFVAWVDRRPETRGIYGQSIINSGRPSAQGGSLVLSDGPGLAPSLHVEQVTQAGRIEVSLPSGTPAHLMLFDVAGRRVLARTLKAMIGTQTMEPGTLAHLPNGLYFLTLRQGEAMVTKRVMLLR